MPIFLLACCVLSLYHIFSKMGQCYICSLNFQEEELKKHTRLYQNEITVALDRLQTLVSRGELAQFEATALIARLNNLVSHRGLEVDYTSHGPLVCPHEDCEQKETFSREQDLVRHYALHYPVKETCCDTTFTQAKKYMSHKCLDRISHKKRCNRLRQCIRQTLRNSKRTGGLVNSGGGRRPAISGGPTGEVTGQGGPSSSQLLQSATSMSLSAAVGCDQSVANGMTTSKDQEAEELYQGTSGRVLAAREASSLYLLADAAGRGREERRSAEAAPTLGPTGQTLPHNSPAMLVNPELAAGVGFPLIQSDQVDLNLGSYDDTSPQDRASRTCLASSCDATTSSVLVGVSEPLSASFLTRPISHFRAFFLNDVEPHLFEYFIDKYCKSRTLYLDDKHNSLLRAIPPNPPRAFMAAIFCLTCLYVGFPELAYFQEVILFLRETLQNEMQDSEIPLLASIIRLLIQYHIVKRDRDETWVFHINGFRALQCRILEHAEARNMSIRITYESILKFVPMLQDSQGPNGGLSINYLLTLENPQEIRDYGCSPEVLHLLGCINIADYETSKDSSRRVEVAYSLLARCGNVDQTTPETGQRGKAIKTTAESYVHMARFLIYWRLLSSGKCTSLVLKAGDVLGKCVWCIPAEGELFTAQYPLASAFWAILFSPGYGQKCYDFLKAIWTDRPTNITHALRVAELARGKSLMSVCVGEKRMLPGECGCGVCGSGTALKRLGDVMKSLDMKELSLS
ncbi:hypothetical protein VTK56DRAFT_6311 [Thermocarpiscus australiensis]